MKTDITKLPMNELKHYLGVFLQMGRVQLDSDWNEQSELWLRLLQRQTNDTVREGSPNNGFRVDDRILLDAMDSRIGWAAVKQNITDPTPVLFVDYFDHRTGEGSLTVQGAIELVHVLDKPLDLQELRQVVFAAKGNYGGSAPKFFLGQGGGNAIIPAVKDANDIGQWQIYRASISVPPAIDLSRIDAYGFTSLDKTKTYAFDLIKIDQPIRAVLVPTSYRPAFTATPLSGPEISIGDDDRFWGSTVLKVKQATSVTYAFPVARDLSHARSLVLALKTTPVGGTFSVKFTDKSNNTAMLAAPTTTTVSGWQVQTFALPQGAIDWSQIKQMTWDALTPATTYLLSPVLLEMALDGSLVIMGGDGTSEGAGRFYGDGLTAVKETHETYFSQRDLPQADLSVMALPADGKCRADLAYLDLWERPITYIEDPDIREVALEGPDTCTRTQLVAQVRIMKGAEIDYHATLPDALPQPPPVPPIVAFNNLPRCGGGRLTTKDKPDAILDPCADPCEPEVVGTFMGEQNRLFRIEVHTAGGIGPQGDPNTATFKWSRENGATASALLSRAEAGTLWAEVEKPELFNPGDLIEVSDDLVDLITGPHSLRSEAHGELHKIDAIDLQNRKISWVDSALTRAYAPAYHARIRRWDDVLAATPGDIVLADGVVIEFGGAAMLPGDFWVFTTRVVDRSVERLIDAPPQGVCHRYFKLATVTRCKKGGEDEIVIIEDCRHTFNPLTELQATDVKFDPGHCATHETDWENVENVQEAIEALCRLDRDADLRLHNKYVHGSGIVCGLKVKCSEDRSDVILESGYALDCEGNSILVEREQSVDIVAMAKKQKLLDNNDGGDVGNGDVCLSIDRGASKDAVITIEPEVHQSFWDSVLEGSLLLDFYNHCIKNVLDFLRTQFLPIPATTLPVPPSHKLLVSLLNLLWQLINPTTGRYVFLSTDEHSILLNFYNDLKNLLQSESFCAMFDNVNPFPEYPYKIPPGIETSFGLFGFHTRLRLHPGGKYAYTCGTGNKIHVFDLTKHEMVESLTFPSGTNLDVQDVAFSLKGDKMYAVGILSGGDDSIFATALIGPNQSHTWGPVSVLCDTKFVTLATSAAQPQKLYAIGKAKGLYEFDPNAIPPTAPSAKVSFNATGLLTLSTDGTMGFAAESGAGIGTESSSFAKVRGFNINSGASLFSFPPPGPPALIWNDKANDMVFSNNVLFVTGDAPKKLYALNATTGALIAQHTLTNTLTRLTPLTNSDYLLVAQMDENRIIRVNRNSLTVDTRFRIPVQIMPIGLTSNARGSEVHAYNYLSNTVSVINIETVFVTNPIPSFTNEAPSSLSQYRLEILQAFGDILGKFLQYLKDCFCDKFLIDCPQCDKMPKVYLGCVEIKDGKVYHICNFTKRRYVKSVRTVEYWLSVVPIIPMIKTAFSKFCCKVF
jgi:DNA-binding beta-propeller fold protein YncE